jgi:uncharacterized protein YcbX
VEVHKLFIYPIKGFRGVEIQSGFALDRGMKGDRRLMLVDDTGTFVSQRTVPALTHFRIKVGVGNIQITYKEESITILLDDFLEEKTFVKVWKSSFFASAMNKKYNGFFSDLLGGNYYLVAMRASDVREKKISDGMNIEVSFADGYPYLITGTASLADLNEKLETSIPMERFRANIILHTSDAFQEEKIDTFHLGNTLFKMVNPCKRCQVITIDQDNGVSSAEPLKTLSTYRKFDGGVNFGMNAICLEEGLISQGNRLTVLRK